MLPLIPKRFASKTLHNLENYDAEIEEAMRAITHGIGVCLIGPCGSGKTHFATGLFKEVVKRRVRVNDEGELDYRMCLGCRWASAYDFLFDLKKAMGTEISDDAIISQWTMPEVLLLDEIGVENVSDWSRFMMYALINERYIQERFTIITSNLSLDHLAERIDDRIGSRINEMCHVMTLKGTGESGDHRLQLIAERKLKM